jgi:hypothetical protein
MGREWYQKKMDREKFIKIIKSKFILHIYDSNIVKRIILEKHKC